MEEGNAMIMTVSPLVIWFVKGMICLFLIGFIYSLWKYYITDKTFADAEVNRINAIQKQNPEFCFIHDKPEPKYVITVLYRIRNPYEVTLEKVRFISEYVASKVKKGKTELFFLTPFGSTEYSRQVERLGRVFPGVVHACVEEDRVREFTVAAIRARGKFIIHADFLEEELEKVLEMGDSRVLRVTSLEASNTGFIKASSEMIFKSVEKTAAWDIFRSLHTSEYGVSREIEKICEEKKVKLDAEKKESADEHTILYWCWLSLYEKFVDQMYRFNLWTYRK